MHKCTQIHPLSLTPPLLNIPISTLLPPPPAPSVRLCESVRVYANLSRVYANLREFMQICANLHDSGGVYANLRESARVYVNLHEFTQICASLRESARVCASLRESARVCANLCEFARICLSFRETARVCAEGLAKTPGLCKNPKLRNLNLIFFKKILRIEEVITKWKE